MPESSQTYSCSCRENVFQNSDSFSSTNKSFDDMLCEDVIVIICSYLGPDELWNNTRRVNLSFRNQSMKDRLWKEMYHSRWGLADDTNVCIYHQVVNHELPTCPWWKIYMQRHKWLSFEFNSMEGCFATMGEVDELFHSVNCLDDGLIYYERLHSLGKVAGECGLHLISQQKEQNNKKSPFEEKQTYPNNTPKSNIETSILFCKLFLKTYFGKVDYSRSKSPNSFFSAILNLQVFFLLVQSLSIIGEYDKVIAYSTECLDCIHSIKRQNPVPERTSSEELTMEKISEKCTFYRGYSSHKLGLYAQAEKDLEMAESFCSLSNEEECSMDKSNSRRYYHLMNILFTLINNSVKLKQYQKSLEYFIRLISLVKITTKCKESSQTTASLELVDDKSWYLLNSWFPGVPYFFLAEYLYKQQDYSASKILFEQYINYEQGRKYSVHNKQSSNHVNPSKDKQLVHAINRINQINSVIQSDQEY